MVAMVLASVGTFADANCQQTASCQLASNCPQPTTSYSWKVPNWNIIITEPGAVQKWIGKVWSGHCQGMCVSSNAIYFSFHDQIVKTDWQGRLLRWTEVDRHGGDICIWNGKLYTGVARKPKAKGGKWMPCIYVYDAETLKKINELRLPNEGGCDGITVLDGVIYLALGCTGKYDFEKKCGCLNKYQKFNAETLEPIGEPILIDDGEKSICGSQNMCTDGKYIYSSHYTYDERERTPNVVVHDKDTFKVITKYRFGWNHGLDVVPGGKDGAVRFAWVFTPNWTTKDKYDTRLNVYGIVQFVEVKDGQVFDFTEHGTGAGFAKFIER